MNSLAYVPNLGLDSWMLEHNLSDETLALLEQAIDAIAGRLAIYGKHSWAIERTEHDLSFAFDPFEDSQYLRDELRRIGAGRF
jgi:hypothetical protein